MSYFPPLFLSFYISDTAPAHIRKSIKFRWDYHLIIEKLVQNSFLLLFDDLPSSYDISNYGSILVFPGLCPRQSDGSGSEPRYHWSSWRIGYICNKKGQNDVFFCNPRTDNHVEVSSYRSSLQDTQSYGSVPNLSWRIESTYFEFYFLSKRNYVGTCILGLCILQVLTGQSKGEIKGSMQKMAISAMTLHKESITLFEHSPFASCYHSKI